MAATELVGVYFFALGGFGKLIRYRCTWSSAAKPAFSVSRRCMNAFSFSTFSRSSYG